MSSHHYLSFLHYCRGGWMKNRLALTHWGRDKMDVISQTTFSSAFCRTKMFELRWNFHWNLFLWVQLTIFQHWFRQWLGADQATSHYLNQWWLDYWRIYASFGLNELNEHNGTTDKYCRCLMVKTLLYLMRLEKRSTKHYPGTFLMT